MAPDEKVLFGILAIGATSLVFTAMGLHINPLGHIAGAFEL